MRLARFAQLIGTLLFAFGSFGCRCEPNPLSLEVWYDGCASVWRGPTCLLDGKREMMLWVRTNPSAKVTIDFGPHAVVKEQGPVDGGRRYSVLVPKGVERGRVNARTEDARGGWQLTLGDAPTEPSWLTDARRLRKVPKTAEAIALVDPHLTDPNSTWRARALGLGGRLAMDQGQIDRTCELLEQAGQLNKELGHESEAVADFLALAFQHISFTRQFDEARRALLLTGTGSTGHVDAEIVLSSTWSQLATKTGDLRSALARLRFAIQIEKRAGRQDRRLGLELSLASVISQMGLLYEGAQRLDDLRREMSVHTSACMRSLVLNNEAAILLLAADAGEKTTINPIPLLRQAIDLLDGSCPLSKKLASIRINLSLAYLQAGQYDKAKAELAWLTEQSGRLTAQDEAWRLDVEGRLAFADGRVTEALALFRRQERLAEVSFLPHERWRAVVGQARSLLAQSKEPEALAQYDRAETLSEQSLLRVPVDASRGAFVAQHRQAVREHVELLVRSDRVREAMQICRRERVRAWDALRIGAESSLLSPAEKERIDRELGEYWRQRKQLDDAAAKDWQVPVDQVEQVRQQRQAQSGSLNNLLDRAFGTAREASSRRFVDPGPNELRLLYFPLNTGWLGFAEDTSGVVARPIEAIAPSAAPSELAERLLRPFDEQLKRAQRVKVLSMGRLEDVDVHSLPWQGAPLDFSRSVVYSLDASAEDKTVSSGNAPLVVAVVDPAYDLPGARSEAEILRAHLGHSPVPLRLHDRADVSAAALGQELDQALLFHFSGHGKFQGAAGWDSALVLSEGSQLLVTDVLALRSAPDSAVLLGCETARSGGEWSVGLGLAHAFLLAGSRLVVATSRPIKDDLAARLSAELYRDWRGQALDVETVISALRRLRQTNPKSDWDSIRILVR